MGLEPAGPDDEPAVLLQLEGQYALDLWRRVVKSFDGVGCVEPGGVRGERIASPALAERSPRILVVNDEECIRRVLVRSLERSFPSALVVALECGLGALAILDDFRPDLLILDDFMPGPTGYEILETIRDTPAVASTPVLFLSSSCTWTHGPRPDLRPLGYVDPFKIGRDLEHLVASALTTRGFEFPSPDGGWPTTEINEFEYLDPAFRRALLGGARDAEPIEFK